MESHIARGFDPSEYVVPLSREWGVGLELVPSVQFDMHLCFRALLQCITHVPRHVSGRVHVVSVWTLYLGGHVVDPWSHVVSVSLPWSSCCQCCCQCSYCQCVFTLEFLLSVLWSVFMWTLYLGAR